MSEESSVTYPIEMKRRASSLGSLNDFSQFCHAEAKAKGWHALSEGPARDPKRIATMLLLVQSELCEAFECIRAGVAPTLIYRDENDGADHEKPEGFPIEIADAFIRLGDMVAALGIDIDKAVSEKLAFNRTRAHRHGGRVA